MQIESIKRSSANKYTVIIDKKKHIIFGDVLLDLWFLKPQKITEHEYDLLLERNAYYESYLKIVSFISYKMRSEKEVITKLIKLKVSKKNQREIIKKLKDDGYLNDDKYLQSYVNDQVNLTLNGPLKILNTLKKDGFKDEKVTLLLDNIDKSIWEEKIKKIISKKIKANHNLSSQRFILKIKMDLKNMGYSEYLYLPFVSELVIDDENQLKKDMEKYLKKYSLKYQDEKLKLMIKQKLYSLGYSPDQINNLLK